MKKYTGDCRQFGKPWQDTQCTMTLSHLLLDDEQMCPVHPRKEEWGPAHNAGIFPNILREDVLSSLKERKLFISRCVGRDSTLWGRRFVSCNMRKAVALCPGMDNFTMRTL